MPIQLSASGETVSVDRKGEPSLWPEPSFPLKGMAPEIKIKKTILEPERKIPVRAESDVAIFGGGPAGVCAATAAARLGFSVLLVERHGFFGGMATAANVNVWHTLYGMDKTTKVIGGLAEEIIRRLQREKAIRNKAADGETGDWVVCTETCKFVLDDLVLGSGAKTLFHTRLAGVIRDGRNIKAAIIEGKSGREAILAKVFIDCTGDADLIRQAGGRTTLGNHLGRCQPPTLCFRISGVGENAASFRDIQKKLFEHPMDYNHQHYPCHLWGTRGIWDTKERMIAGVRVLGINAADTHDFSCAEIEGRYQLRWILDQMRTMKGYKSMRLVDIASQIGIRETHRIIADHALTREEVLSGQRFHDVIAQGTYPIDIHEPDGPGILFEHLDGVRDYFNGQGEASMSRWDGAKRDAPKRNILCWQVPYRSLIPCDFDNILVAGRCIGANHDSAGAIRVMINAMQFGEAAGTASAMTNGSGAVRKIDVRRLHSQLCRQGATFFGKKPV